MSKKTDFTWGWWAIQLLVPGIIAIFLLIMEIGHLIGYFPHD